MSTILEAVIGVEVHVQLATRSKMFCGCRADVFGAEPNTLVCPVCLGLPGSLPAINRQAVEYAVMMGLALNCQVASLSRFYRKNYHYPDLVKGYQITMYGEPLCENGFVDLEVDGTTRRIRIRRVHLEEETGKSIHVEGYSYLDFNRSGIPLLEVVTEPDFRAVDEVQSYVQELQRLVRYLGVGSGDMEKGALRIEPNVSLRPAGTTSMGTKVELKNLNSFRSVQRGLEYEIQRQREALERGEALVQETRGWDEERQATFSQRSKEYAEDYRYFPEPDLPPLRLDATWIEELRVRLPELPWERRARFVEQYGLGAGDAALLTQDPAVADYFEEALHESHRLGQVDRLSPQVIAHWTTGDLFRLLKESDRGISEIRLQPALLVETISLVEEGTVTGRVGKEILARAFATGESPAKLVQDHGLGRISDVETLAAVVQRVIAENPTVVADFLGGKETAIRYLIGRVMRATRGKADPNLSASLLEEKLDSLRKRIGDSAEPSEGERR